MKLFAGEASQHLAQRIAESMGVRASMFEEYIFPDGERRVRIVERVVGEHVIIVQSTPPPVDMRYLQTLLYIDAAKRSGSSQVTLVMPYMGYMRQDHVFLDGEAVSIIPLIRSLEAAGADRVISLDMHSVKIEEMFHVPIVHLSALPLFAREITAMSSSRAVLVSPDMGGIGRIERLSDLCGGMPYVAVKKNRDLHDGTLSVSRLGKGEISSDIQEAYIVDDMIASGGTIIEAAKLLRDMGIAKISVFATHGVCVADAKTRLQAVGLQRLVVTDTIEQSDLDTLSVAESIADVIRSSS
jgi:ribose-phosphate pyrophosphokinase